MSDDIREQIIAELKVAYWMELETVMSYIANSTNLDGVRAEEIKKSLAADVTLRRRVRRLARELDPNDLARDGHRSVAFLLHRRASLSRRRRRSTS